MRRLRIAAPSQLALALGDDANTEEQLWSTMPESTQLEVLALFARMVARGVIELEGEEQ